jgi:hypothetical protein
MFSKKNRRRHYRAIRLGRKTRLYEQLEARRLMAADFWQAAAQAGDFDHNGVVDGTDFLVWQRALGTTEHIADAVIDRLDLGVWNANLGTIAGLPSVNLTGGVLNVVGSEGDDVITFRQRDGRLTIDGLDAYFAVADVSQIIVDARGGNDRVDLNRGSVNPQESIVLDAVVHGGAGADFIRGGYGNDHILGGDGNDDLRGGSGNDRIDGQLGTDVVLGDAGYDVLLDKDSDDPLLGDDLDLVEGGLNAVYDGSSPVVQMLPFNGGMLTAFSNAGHGYRVHWSPDGKNLGSGPIVYDGVSPVVEMLPYNGGVLTAFAQAGPNGYRIHWSPDGMDLGGGPIVYDGSSPVVQMLPYNGGVLTAFANAGSGYRIHWSSDGRDLGSGPIVYEGSSPVVEMLAYNGGVLTAFANAGPGYRIHWSADGNNLGGGPIVYEGASPVVQMLPYNGGVLTAFANAGPGYRIHWSPDGNGLGNGAIVYEGASPVVQMLAYNGGVMTAFANAGPSGHRIHWSSDGANLGGGPIVYDGSSPVVRMSVYGQEILTAFSAAGPNGNRIHISFHGQQLGGMGRHIRSFHAEEDHVFVLFDAGELRRYAQGEAVSVYPASVQEFWIDNGELWVVTSTGDLEVTLSNADAGAFMDRARQRESGNSSTSKDAGDRSVVGGVVEEEYLISQFGDATAPRTILDSVAKIVTPNSFGSGTLLAIGGNRYVLTAAHVVENESGSLYAAGALNVKLNGVNRGVANVIGRAAFGGKDLALIELVNSAPDIQGAEITSATPWDGIELLVVGYGTDNDGNSGSKTFGFATYDRANHEPKDFNDGGSIFGVGPHLINDVTSGEVAAAKGDSGGPDFLIRHRNIGGQWMWIPEVVGVHSYGEYDHSDPKKSASVQITADVKEIIRQLVGVRQVALDFFLNVTKDGDKDAPFTDAGEWNMTLNVNGAPVLSNFRRDFVDAGLRLAGGERIASYSLRLDEAGALAISFYGIEEDGFPRGGPEDIPRLDVTFKLPSIVPRNGLRSLLGMREGETSYELFVEYRVV